MSTFIVALGAYQPYPMPPNMPRVGVIGGFAITPADITYESTPASGTLFEQVTGLGVDS